MFGFLSWAQQRQMMDEQRDMDNFIQNSTLNNKFRKVSTTLKVPMTKNELTVVSKSVQKSSELQIQTQNIYLHILLWSNALPLE